MRDSMATKIKNLTYNIISYGSFLVVRADVRGRELRGDPQAIIFFCLSNREGGGTLGVGPKKTF